MRRVIASQQKDNWIMQAVNNYIRGIFFLDTLEVTGNEFLISFILPAIWSQNETALALRIWNSHICTRSKNCLFRLTIEIEYSIHWSLMGNISKASSMLKVLPALDFIICVE